MFSVCGNALLAATLETAGHQVRYSKRSMLELTPADSEHFHSNHGSWCMSHRN
jgi:hypothetical protein